ncbi:MAG: orotidine-5'-phosphate decarboxylase [bacterium]
MKNNNKIIIALDGITEKKALQIAKLLKEYVWGFKINDLLFENIKIIQKLKKFGKVFADAKLYDIPNTVSNSVKRLSKAGADIITVHASGGIEMMKSAKQNAGQSKIIAVTVLTSFKKNSKKVISLVKNSIEANVDGVVCSGHDLSAIRHIPNSQSLLKIVPGIRPIWYKKKDDQKQIITPDESFKLGADYLVIGRPILDAKDIVKALLNI